MGQQTKKTFEEVQEPKSRRPLELIHADVCGSFVPHTSNQKRYLVTVTDDYTHFTVVYIETAARKLEAGSPKNVNNGYCIWNVEKGKLFVSRDVILMRILHCPHRSVAWR